MRELGRLQTQLASLRAVSKSASHATDASNGYMTGPVSQTLENVLLFPLRIRRDCMSAAVAWPRSETQPFGTSPDQPASTPYQSVPPGCRSHRRQLKVKGCRSLLFHGPDRRPTRPRIAETSETRRGLPTRLSSALFIAKGDQRIDSRCTASGHPGRDECHRE